VVTAPTKKGRFPKMANILKPQKHFAVVPKNDETGPFMPLLTQKPHAMIPLEVALRTETESDGKIRYVPLNLILHFEIENLMIILN
jgi:exosome complex exonuclease RRP6